MFVEGVTVVSSILLAFGIDAWWSGRQERIDEAELLQALRTELIANRSLLDEGIQRHADIAIAAHALAVAVEGGEPLPQDDEELLDLARLAFVRIQTTNLPNGAVTALLASGDISLITSRALRARLSEWTGLVSEAMEDEDLANRVAPDVGVPFFLEELPGWGFRSSDPDVGIASMRRSRYLVTAPSSVRATFLGDSGQPSDTARGRAQRAHALAG